VSYHGIIQTSSAEEALEAARACIAKGVPFYARRVEFRLPETFFNEPEWMLREHAPIEYEVYADYADLSR
jgi:hypothetical protein